MYIKPDFYDKFVCKADKCTDTCCAGWEICIDEPTIEKYDTIDGPFRDRIKSSILSDDGQFCFKLDSDERCCFLAKNGLCDIYSELGEDYLCEICKEHPRFYDEFDGITQAGLGLCCEKVCELLLDCEKLEFDNTFDYDVIAEDTAILLRLRDTLFDMLDDKTKNFTEKVKEILDYSAEAESELFGVSSCLYNFRDKKSVIEDVLCLYGKTEPINVLWTGFLYKLNNNLYSIFSCGYEPDSDLYVKILKYIIYRHFMNCRFDGRIYDVVRFAVFGLVFIYASECLSFITQGEVTDNDKINAIKRWSQQIEYSQENTDMCLTFYV